MGQRETCWAIGAYDSSTKDTRPAPPAMNDHDPTPLWDTLPLDVLLVIFTVLRLCKTDLLACSCVSHRWREASFDVASKRLQYHAQPPDFTWIFDALKKSPPLFRARVKSLCLVGDGHACIDTCTLAQLFSLLPGVDTLEIVHSQWVNCAELDGPEVRGGYVDDATAEGHKCLKPVPRLKRLALDDLQGPWESQNAWSIMHFTEKEMESLEVRAVDGSWERIGREKLEERQAKRLSIVAPRDYSYWAHVIRTLPAVVGNSLELLELGDYHLPLCVGLLEGAAERLTELHLGLLKDCFSE